MSDQFTPSVAEQTNTGPTLQEQAVEMGIEHEGLPQPEAHEAQEGLILGKFQSHADLEQAYQSLEQRMGQQSPDMSQPMTQAAEYYNQYGELSDEHYEALGRAGINRSFVDSYITGQQAQNDQTTTEYYNTVGGEENYQQMSEWMQEYLPDGEIEAYNRVMTNGSDDEVHILMSGMFSRYQSAMNTNYEQVQGQTGPEAPLGFQSRGQVMEMLNDPRYEYDEAFRMEFEQKLALTSEDVF